MVTRIADPEQSVKEGMREACSALYGLRSGSVFRHFQEATAWSGKNGELAPGLARKLSQVMMLYPAEMAISIADSFKDRRIFYKAVDDLRLHLDIAGDAAVVRLIRYVEALVPEEGSTRRPSEALLMLTKVTRSASDSGDIQQASTASINMIRVLKLAENDGKIEIKKLLEAFRTPEVFERIANFSGDDVQMGRELELLRIRIRSIEIRRGTV